MRYRLFVLILLASVGFFNPYQLLPVPLQKLILYTVVVGSYAYVLSKYPRVNSNAHYPRVAYGIVLLSIAASVIMASAFHKQGLLTSIVATTSFVVPYSVFYLLLKLDVPRTRIINTYLVLCGISIFVYAANMFTAPYNIYGEPMLGEDLSRGILRVRVEFIEIFPLLIFYAINRWLLEKRTKWLWIIAVGVVMVFLSVTRQIIAATIILGLLFMFRSVSWTSKLLMSGAVVAVVLWVLPLIPIYNTMMELSDEQRDENEETENIRITSWRYYTYENQTNALSPIFGNGVPAIDKSRWGIMWDTETQENGCFPTDVGWAGFFWQFGAIATGALLWLLCSAMLKRKPPQRQYLTYWFVFIIGTSIASGPILYSRQIISICVGLYLVYRPSDDDDLPQPLIPSQRNQASDATDSSHNTELQQRRRYPQLPRLRG